MTLAVAVIGAVAYPVLHGILGRGSQLGRSRTRASRAHATFLAGRTRALRLIRMAGAGNDELDRLRARAEQLSRLQRCDTVLGAL